MPLRAVSSESHSLHSAAVMGAARDERKLGWMSRWFAAIRNRAVRFLAIWPGRAKLKSPQFSTLEKEEQFSDRQMRLPKRPLTMSTGFGRLPRAGIPGWMPKTNLPPCRHALGVLARNRGGCTTTMLSARGVKVETIEKLIAVGFAIKKSDLVGRGKRPITRIEITEAGRLALPTITT